MDELDYIKKLAGVNEFKGYTPYQENISHTGTEKREIERKKNLRPGDEDWFKLWFSRPYYWYNENGELHREDGPAVEWADGSKEWYINGKHYGY